MNPNESLSFAYKVLEPYSKKYIVDKKRYQNSLELLLTIPKLKTKKILDIGTGIGLMPLALNHMGIDASGLDYYIFPKNSNPMFNIVDIEKLEKLWNTHNIVVHNQDVYHTNTTIKPESYDIILSEATIEHLKNPKEFLARCYELLAPGGYMLITTPNIATLLKRLRFFIGKSPLWPIEQFFEDGEQFTGHWREYTMKELIYMCKKSNFDIIKTENKNSLTKFKKWNQWGKNGRALIMLISSLMPGAGEMHYLLCKKNKKLDIN